MRKAELLSANSKHPYEKIFDTRKPEPAHSKLAFIRSLHENQKRRKQADVQGRSKKIFYGNRIYVLLSHNGTSMEQVCELVSLTFISWEREDINR